MTNQQHKVTAQSEPWFKKKLGGLIGVNYVTLGNNKRTCKNHRTRITLLLLNLFWVDNWIFLYFPENSALSAVPFPDHVPAEVSRAPACTGGGGQGCCTHCSAHTEASPIPLWTTLAHWQQKKKWERTSEHGVAYLRRGSLWSEEENGSFKAWALLFAGSKAHQHTSMVFPWYQKTLAPWWLSHWTQNLR